MRRITFPCGLLIGLVVVSASTQSQEVSINPQPNDALINDVESLAVARHPVAKYLSSGCVALAEIDLAKLNEAESLNWLRQAFSIGDGHFVDAAAAAIYSIESIGTSHAYVLASLDSIPQGSPLLAIPCDDTATVKHDIELLLQMADLTDLIKVGVDNRIVLVGSEAALEAARRQPVRLHERSDVIIPMQQKEHWDHRLILTLPEETRRELVAFWPDQLPANGFVGISPKQLVADIKRLEVSLSASPDSKLFAKIETFAPEATDRVLSALERLFAIAPEVQEAADLKIENGMISVKVDAAKATKTIEGLFAKEIQRAGQISTQSAARQILLAIHNHHGAHQYLPPRCLTDREGNALLSWRVSVLPFIERAALYNRFHLGEAWDSETNQPFSKVTIPVFSGGIDPSAQPGMTRFRAPVFPGSLWHGDGPPRSFRDVTDGTSNTIAIIFAPQREAVPWSSPEPWIISEDDPLGDVFGDSDQVTVVALDGAVHVLRREEVDKEKLTALLTIAGREEITW